MKKAVKKSAKVRHKTSQVNVRLPERMLNEIDRHLNPLGFGQVVERTELIRRAIDEYLRSEGAYLKYPKYGTDEDGRLVVFHKGKFLVFPTVRAPQEFDSFEEVIKSLYPDGVNRLFKL